MPPGVQASKQTDFSNSGYFGPAHQSALLARENGSLKDYVARFKHALLFNQKLVLADHMTFSPNFQAAYRTDDEFKHLLRGDLVELAHFEKFANGGAFTLVQFRKFREYLNRGQDPRYSPLNSDCPSDPFDDDLDVIQENLGRRFPDGSQRDSLFTSFADQEIEREALHKDLGDLWTIYRTAYKALRADVAAQGYPLGIVHFDVEHHRSPRTEIIFDYMARASSLPSGQHDRLVKEIGKPIIRSHRTLLIKAEMGLLPGAYAVLPSDLAPYRASVFNNSNGETIDEIEANVRERKIDLAAVNRENLALLTLEEILDIRKAGKGLFEIIRERGHKTEEFDLIWKLLTEYCYHVNDRLYARKGKSGVSERGKNLIRLVQGKLAAYATTRDVVIATVFKVLGAVSHTQAQAQFGVPEAGAAFDATFEQAKTAVRSMVDLKPLSSLTQDVKSHLVIHTKDRDKLMYYND